MEKSLRVLSIALILIMGVAGLSLASNGSGVALSGYLPGAANNPAGLSGLNQTEFGLSYVLNNEGSNDFAIHYAEPGYGRTGAGLLSFNKTDDVWDLNYGVATSVLDVASLGLALTYLSYPTDTEVRDQYVSTKFGAQVNYWLLRFGIAVENALYLPVGETEITLKMNVLSGVAIDILDYGVLTVEVNDTFNQSEQRQFFVGAIVNPIWDLYIRAGWGPDITAGIGYQYEEFIVNYDWAPGQHRFGFGFIF